MSDEYGQGPQSLQALLDAMTPEVYENLQSAVALGKWQDGSRLSSDQIENCMQAIILYEARHVPESGRIGGHMSGCASRQEDTQELRILGLDGEDNNGSGNR